MSPATIRSATTAVCTRSPRNFGKTTPRDTAPTWWPARPTRCSPLATDGGDSTWMTRSTAPMSMPSSRLEVATTAGSRPALRSSSMSARCSRETEPWWARASTCGAPPDDAGLRHHLRRGTRDVEWRALGALPGDLVEPGAEPLGQPPRVGEHQGRPVREDQVGDPLLDMRPHRGVPGARLAAGGLRQRGEVLHRDDDAELDPLVGGRPDHLDVAGRAAEEARDLVDRADRRRQADPLGPAAEQGVEALQGQRQMGSPLGAGDGVHLVDDDRLHAAQALAGGRGEDQVERLGRRDEDVRWGAGQPAALVGRGVAGAHADGDLRLLAAQAPGRLPDPGERRAQVALDVDGQRLERRDVEDPAAQRAVVRRRRRGQPVEGPQEGGQRLAGAGGRDDQHVPSGRDRVPGAGLGGCRTGEGAVEPGARRRGEAASAVRPGGRVGAPLIAPLHAPILSRPTDDVGRWGFSRRSIGPIVSVCDPSARPAWPSWLP